MTNSYNWSHRKLTDAQAEDVRREYATGKISLMKLAKKHGCGESTILRIVKRKYYVKPNPLEQV